MPYECYLDGVLLPVTPGALSTKINGANQTMTLINEGEINLLKAPGLSEVSFELLLPHTAYSFCNGTPLPIDAYLGKLERLMTEKKPFQFIINRTRPDGSLLYNSNLTVSLEEYEIEEDAEDLGFDVRVSVELKQWREYGTKKLKLSASDESGGQAASVTQERPAQSAPKRESYTVQSGDCLWNIAKKYLGDGSRYQEIYDLNKNKITNPNLIYPGQTLALPG